MNLLNKICINSGTSALLILTVLLAGIAAASDKPRLVTTPEQAFIEGAFVVKGEGAAPGGKGYSKGKKQLSAIRAAKVDALRNLAEILNTVTVTGVRSLADISKESSEVAAQVKGFVRGASVIKEDYNSSTEVAVVYVRLAVTGEDGILGTLTAAISDELRENDFVSSNKIEKTYDGLIIDTIGFDFTPAIVNRVIVKGGGVVYGPSKIAQAVLVKKGAADYTTEVGKARAVLKEMGALYPLVVKVESIRDNTDTVISQLDAELVASANNESSFLEGANVVFVLE